MGGVNHNLGVIRWTRPFNPLSIYNPHIFLTTLLSVTGNMGGSKERELSRGRARGRGIEEGVFWTS